MLADATIRWGWLFVVLSMGACGGSGSPDGEDAGTADASTHDAASGDAATDAGIDAAFDGGAGDDATVECVCSAIDACCDGCRAIRTGESCDDGRACTLSATCDDDGVCRGEVDACAYLIDEPQCQAVGCDDTYGCGGVTNIREGFACDDGDPATEDDRCVSGACVGTACECEEGPCCDGCHFRPVTHRCGEREETIVEASCVAAPIEGCAADREGLELTRANVWCSGSSAACDGEQTDVASSTTCCEGACVVGEGPTDSACE